MIISDHVFGYYWSYLLLHCYLIIQLHSWILLKLISQVHELLGSWLGIQLFLLTSFLDPGIVNSTIVPQYLFAYPYDNIIFSEKECSTCKIPKPARSKHCIISYRYVARFNYHCGWMNNCIRERNTRYFMAFILW